MKSKQLKLPPLNAKTRILSFDVEANGLHGEAFAVGAVVVDAEENVLNEFSARAEIVGEADEWVAANVLPAIADMPITHHSYEELQEGFWQWYLKAEPESDYVLVSNGYPVEYRFLIKCQDADLKNRYWQHPFPILDLRSLLFQVGERSFPHTATGPYHHPLQDAKKAALTAFKALRKSGQLKQAEEVTGKD